MPDEITFKFVKPQRAATILGVAFSGGQPKAGVEEGPIRLVEYGLIDQVKELGWNVDMAELFDYTTLKPASDPDHGQCKNPRYVGAVTRKVAEHVANIARQGKLAITLGGDHSIALGTVSGSMSVHKDACLIWVDAHAQERVTLNNVSKFLQKGHPAARANAIQDINTPQGTVSGNLHGCPVSWLLGIAGDVPGFEWVKPVLTVDRLVYVGLRDVDEHEKELLKKHKIKAFSMHDVDRWGIGRVMEMALDHVNPKRDRPIHLSFDVDALDPSVAPSTGTPVRGGLTFREGHYICEAIAETGCLAAVDIVEVNPALGDEAALFQTVAIGCSLVRCSVGETLL